MEIQNTFSSVNIITILPEIIIVLSMIILIIIDLSFTQKNNLNLTPIILTSIFTSIIVLFLQWIDLLPAKSFDNFRSDSFSIVFRLFILLASFLCILLSKEYIKRAGLEFTEFVIFLLTATVGSMFLSGANDLITIFISLELLGLSSYLLAAYSKKDVRSNEAAMKYLLVGGTSSAILVYGFSWLYGLSGGQINLSQLTNGLREANLNNSIAGWTTLIFIIVGIGFKLSIVPFHQWTPDVYEGSPTPVVAFLSVVSKSAGLAITMRIVSTIFPYLQEDWKLILQLISILTMIVGNLIAMTQTSMKRMLAYSSISQAGYLMIGIIASENEGYASVLVYILIYIFMNLGAFGCVILFGLRTGTDQIRDYSGLYMKDPWLATCFTIFLLSLAGIPPMAGFFGKIYLFWCGWQSGLYLLTGIGLITSVISIYYYLRIIKIMTIKEGKEMSFYTQNYISPSYSSIPKSSLEITMFICVIASTIMGISINPIINIAKQTIISTIPFSI